MGCDKLLLPFAETALLEHVLASFPYALFATTIVVVSRPQTHLLAQPFPVQVVYNRQPETGKSGSIRLALAASPPGNRILFMVADQPLLRPQTITRLVDTSHRHPDKIICPLVDDRRANPVIFPPQLRPMLADLPGDSGGSLVIDRYPHLLHGVPCTDEGEFLDIDTNEQYRKARRLWQTR